MSEKLLDINEDWDEIKKQFKAHFNDQNLEISKEEVTYTKPGEHLTIRHNGEVFAGMPLHQNEVKNVEKIKITDSEIKILSKGSEYTYRR